MPEIDCSQDSIIEPELVSEVEFERDSGIVQPEQGMEPSKNKTGAESESEPKPEEILSESDPEQDMGLGQNASGDRTLGIDQKVAKNQVQEAVAEQPPKPAKEEFSEVVEGQDLDSPEGRFLELEEGQIQEVPMEQISISDKSRSPAKNSTSNKSRGAKEGRLKTDRVANNSRKRRKQGKQKLNGHQKQLIADATNIPLRIQVGWLLDNGVSLEKIAKRCGCSIAQIRGLMSGKWSEPASLIMEHRILELVGETYAKNGKGARGSLRRMGETSYVSLVPKPNYMPKPPMKDLLRCVDILIFYRDIGFTQQTVKEIAGISDQEYEQALLGKTSASSRRAIINSLDRYENFLLQ